MMPRPADLDEFIAAYPAPDSSSSTREEACREFWNRLHQADRVKTLLKVLARYRTCRSHDSPQRQDREHLRESFALNELTSIGYGIGMRPTEQEALAILHAAHHTCGHGSDTRPPLDLALRHFRKKPFTLEFFDAIQAYRDSLAQSRHTTAQQLKGHIDLLLWQDWRKKTKWQSCWSARIRADIKTMPTPDRERWNALFQSFVHCYNTEPTKKWLAASEQPLEKLTAGSFSSGVLRWLSESTVCPRPQLSAAGSHVLKNLIWCAEVVSDQLLDRSLVALIDLPWKNRQPMEKVAVALARLWSRRDPHAAVDYLERIAKLYAYPGSKIEQYYRSARDLCLKPERP